MNFTSLKRGGPESGFSLIEVMVAVLILSVGLLGMAALMATSLRNNQSADFRSQAVNLAHDQLEMLRSNVANLPAYGRGWTNPAASCAGAEVPYAYSNTVDLFRQDRNYWARKLCRTLPNGSGRVLVSGSVAAGYTATIDVCWTDNREATDQGAACPVLAAGQVGACSNGDVGATCVIRLVSGI